MHHDEIGFYITPTCFLKASTVISCNTRNYNTHDIIREPSQRSYLSFSRYGTILVDLKSLLKNFQRGKMRHFSY